MTDKDYKWINFLMEQAEKLKYGSITVEIVIKDGKIKVIKAGTKTETCNVDIDNTQGK